MPSAIDHALRGHTHSCKPIAPSFILLVTNAMCGDHAVMVAMPLHAPKGKEDEKRESQQKQQPRDRDQAGRPGPAS